MSRLLSYGVRNINCLPSAVNIYRTFGKLVITDDGSTIVALHPQPKFPYEHSRPLPEAVPKKDDSVLKLNNMTEIRRVFKYVSPEVAREELMRLTNTTKHRWFPRARDKRAKKTMMHRPYL